MQQLELRPPYLLVGHSSGGLLANIYARQNPDQVGAVVFVESSHPQQANRFEGHLSAVSRFFQWIANRKAYRDFHSSKEGVGEVNNAGPFPEVPVVVITGQKKAPVVRDSAHAIHLSNQLELAQITPTARQIVTKESGHLPLLTEPELVAEAIRSIAIGL